ncbi:GTPase ObgE [Opitutales bacterium]|nr:GTPase ObgE [bacterium]MDA8991651.1 GTPase ObgE [Opitutales bacterium]
MFYDETKVFLKAGNGGDGCMSFLRQKYMPNGGPNGGNGGKGGDLILLADENVSDLRNYHFKKHWKAKNGDPGRGSDQNGRGGEPCVLKVPLGTEVRDMDSGELVCELLDHNQEILLLEGGKGGRGNTTFKSSINQTPRQFTEGKLGEEVEYKFTLKTIADIGLVGFPNAGKSTLLNILSNATPKIDSYPFTTLVPTVGVIDYKEDYKTLTMADVPGLIEGAAENRGLGHRFLRHVERCRLLLFLLDLAGTDGRNPCDDFEHLRKELLEYDPELDAKPFLVVGNKIDEDTANAYIAEFKKRFSEIELYPISALLEDGLPTLKDKLLKSLG